MKKLLYVIGGVLLIVAIAAALGIRSFNQKWFKETPNHLSFSSEFHPIPFQWIEGTHGDYFEAYEAIKIRVFIEGVSNKLYMQFDTGAPSSILYGNAIKSLESSDMKGNIIVTEKASFLSDFDFMIGENKVKAKKLIVLDGYGKIVDINDTITEWKIGTIGADFLADKITAIDFQDNEIVLFRERPEWMRTLPNFEDFDFSGRRFMLPALFNGKELELFYDSGSSAFGLITTKHRYQKYSDPNTEGIVLEANSWGSSIPIRHKPTAFKIQMGGSTLDLKRVSYIDMYANFQRFISPFSRIGGWLGNKPFINHTLIIDAKQEEFLIVKGSINGN